MEETDLAIMTATELTWFVPAMMLGTKGIFSMAAAHFPHFVIKLYNTCKEGRWEEALKLEKRLSVATEALTGHSSMNGLHGIARFKARCNAAGLLRCGKNRKPMISATDEAQAELTEYCQKEFADMLTP
jgi:dihydrodipicolinate synthase/N-acetylneuraminate lyase